MTFINCTAIRIAMYKNTEVCSYLSYYSGTGLCNSCLQATISWPQ